uniref:SLC26A/SulP transporter domain-containing protein n=1 Tax=Globodera rostochiensis TaxID=31243 RepID=A0A914HWM7_GLORO
MWHDLALASSRANPLTLAISAFGLTFLSLGRLFVSPWFSKRFRIPFPLELFLVILGIIFSSLFHFKESHGVQIVDHVPEGIPLPSVPRFELLIHIWPSVVSVATICYIFVFSLGRIFAKKHNYAVNANQELYALGLCSLLSSFFPVYPSGASLSRSSLCEMTGAKTQLHALFSSALLLIVILWIGSLLEPLPMAILACIVAVSLRPLFMQFGELPKLWRTNVYDFYVWLVAFFSTAFLNITFGLAVSLLFSLFMFGLRKLNGIVGKRQNASPVSRHGSRSPKLPQIITLPQN